MWKFTVGALIDELSRYPADREVMVVARDLEDWVAPISMVMNELYGLDAGTQVGIVVDVLRMGKVVKWED